MEYTMKKKIFFAIFLLAAVLAFTEELTGFMGIDFGTTREEAAKIIEAKGYTLIKDEKVNSTYLNLTGVCFGLPAPIIILSYSKNNLFAGGTFIVELNEDTKADVFDTLKSFRKTFKLDDDRKERRENSLIFYFIAPNKNRLIVTLSIDKAAFTFGYKDTEEKTKGKLQLNDLVDKFWDAEYLTLKYSLLLQKDNSFIFIASGGNIDGMATGTYTITDDIISFSTLSYRGKNVNLIFRQSESYKIENITANSFIMKNTNPPDDLFAMPIPFKLKD